MSSGQDELEPYEHEVRNENESKQRGSSKATRQTTLNFKRAAPASEEDDSDDEDDDLGDLNSFSFAQHTKPASGKEAKMTSVLDDDGPKPSKKPKVERILLRVKWPKGKKPLPEGWEAREYKDGAGGKPYWIYKHPYHGETRKETDMRRSEAEWREATKAKGASSSSRRESFDGSGGGGGDDDDEEFAPALDPLAALLDKKQRKEQEEEEMRERVGEEMRMRMDTGVRVNPDLKKMILQKK